MGLDCNFHDKLVIACNCFPFPLDLIRRRSAKEGEFPKYNQAYSQHSKTIDSLYITLIEVNILRQFKESVLALLIDPQQNIGDRIWNKEKNIMM